jgi:hypothetical protein
MTDFSITIDRGDGRSGTLTFDPPLSSDTAVWLTAKHRYTDTDAQAVYALSTDNGKIVVAGDGVTAEVTFPAEDTNDLVINGGRVELVADVQVQEPAREPETVLRGKVVIRPDVTRTVVE